MDFDHAIFRAYDIRGIVNENFTTEIVYNIGHAFGSCIRRANLRKVALGCDGRLSSPTLVRVLQQGLLASGCTVIDIGQVATPLLYFAASHHAQGSGIMLTGSHNPKDYNGCKMQIGGAPVALDGIQRLAKMISSQDYEHGQGRHIPWNIVDEYIDKVCAITKLRHSHNYYTICIDAGNGVAGSIAPRLFRALGCAVIELYCDVDGNFPNHHPNPSDPANLIDLIAATTTSNAHVGFAFDGDGDRLGVITNAGSNVFADKLLSLYMQDVLSRNAGATIIYDVKSTHLLAGQIRAAGGVPLMWSTGHSLIKQKMQETQALLAGEMSGHIFFAENWIGCDDALLAGARLLQIIDKQTDNSVTQLDTMLAKIPSWLATPEINLAVGDVEKFKIVAALQQLHFANANVVTMDGIRVEYQDGWGLIRASNTSPILVLRFEAENKARLAQIANIMLHALASVQPTLALAAVYQSVANCTK